MMSNDFLSVSCLLSPNWSKIETIICNKLFSGTKNAFDYHLKSKIWPNQRLKLKKRPTTFGNPQKKIEKMRVKTGKLEMPKKVSEQIITPSRDKISSRPSTDLALVATHCKHNYQITDYQKVHAYYCELHHCISLDHNFMGCWCLLSRVLEAETEVMGGIASSKMITFLLRAAFC